MEISASPREQGEPIVADLLEKFSWASSKKPITDRLQDHPKHSENSDLRIPAKGVAHHLPIDTCKTDPDLATVVAAWPGLPEVIKAGIVAMVKAIPGKGDGR
jgi:Golgi nucleoside diphosphatase